MQSHILSIILFAPMVGALLLLFVPGENKNAIRWIANIFALAGLLVSIPLVPMFWTQRFQPGFKFLEGSANNWIPSIGAGYNLGIDGISFLLIMLTTLLGWISILSSWSAIEERVKEYYIWFLILQTGMLGVFMALDFFLFFVFWEAMLVPMYLLIGIWGGPRKLYAAIKFFLYTLFGSVLMLLGILFLYFHHQAVTGVYTFSIPELYKTAPQIPFNYAIWLFLAFFLGFAIKVPMFPFHTWLPDAHVEAPTAGSVLLAGVLLKMGTYGFLRFALPLFPAVALHPAGQRAIVTLSPIGILYGGLVAMVQPDFKKLIAYSSVAHLGFVMLGIWALTLQSVQGALLVMINHGVSTGALFFLAGMLYERRHSRLIEAFGGIAKVAPMLAAVLTIVSLSSIGLPATNGFLGEFLVLLGTFRTYPLAATTATAGGVLPAMYLLPALQRVIFNPLDKSVNEKLPDLSLREIAVLVPLLACIIWIGVYPKPILQRMEPSAQQLIQSVRVNAASSTAAR